MGGVCAIVAAVVAAVVAAASLGRIALTSFAVAIRDASFAVVIVTANATTSAGALATRAFTA